MSQNLPQNNNVPPTTIPLSTQSTQPSQQHIQANAQQNIKKIIVWVSIARHIRQSLKTRNLANQDQLGQIEQFYQQRIKPTFAVSNTGHVPPNIEDTLKEFNAFIVQIVGKDAFNTAQKASWEACTEKYNNMRTNVHNATNAARMSGSPSPGLDTLTAMPTTTNDKIVSINQAKDEQIVRTNKVDPPVLVHRAPPPPGGWLTQPPRKLSATEYLLLSAQQLKDTEYKGIPQYFSLSEGNPPITTRFPPQILAAYPDEWPKWVANPLDRDIRKNMRIRYNEWLKDNKDKVEKDITDYNNYVVGYERKKIVAQLQLQARVLAARVRAQGETSWSSSQAQHLFENDDGTKIKKSREYPPKGSHTEARLDDEKTKGTVYILGSELMCKCHNKTFRMIKAGKTTLQDPMERMRTSYTEYLEKKFPSCCQEIKSWWLSIDTPHAHATEFILHRTIVDCWGFTHHRNETFHDLAPSKNHSTLDKPTCVEILNRVSVCAEAGYGDPLSETPSPVKEHDRTTRACNAVDTKNVFQGNWKSKDGLMTAARIGDKDMMIGLLDARQYIDESGINGRTPLQEALINGHFDIVKELIGRGARLKSNDHSKAMNLAAQNGDLDMVKELISRDARVDAHYGSTALILAAEKGHLDVAKVLVEAGDVNIQQKDGDTALIRAAWRDHLDVVKVLVKAGADVNIQGNYGDTALLSAALMEHMEILKVLVKAGADVNIQQKDGFTALIQAAEKGHLDVVKVLVKAGADVNIQEKDGLTALIWAAQKGRLDVVKVLVEALADLNLQGNNGDTALIKAVLMEHFEIVKVLVKAGAHVNAQGYDGDLALIQATEKGRLDVVKVLVEAGADVNLPYDSGLKYIDLSNDNSRKVADVTMNGRKRKRDDIEEVIEEPNKSGT